MIDGHELGPQRMRSRASADGTRQTGHRDERPVEVEVDVSFVSDEAKRGRLHDSPPDEMQVDGHDGRVTVEPLTRARRHHRQLRRRRGPAERRTATQKEREERYDQETRE